MRWPGGHECRRAGAAAAGHVADLGSLVTSKFPESGQVWRYELDGFELLTLSIDP